VFCTIMGMRASERPEALPPMQAEVDHFGPDIHIVLVEPNASILGGHWSDSLVILARAAREGGVPLAVVCLNGTAPATRAALNEAGAAILSHPESSDIVSRLYLLIAGAFHLLFAVTHGMRSGSPVPFQFLLTSRCFVEAASLRVGRRALPRNAIPVIIVLSASETLGATAAAFSRTPHVRIVHEVYSWESAVLRLMERLCNRWRRTIISVCPTTAIERALRLRYPDARTVVRVFAIAEPEMYLTQEERTAARNRLGIRDTEMIGSLVGGWWRAKDIHTVQRAFSLARRPVGIIIAGSPVDDNIVEQIRRNAPGRVFVLSRQLETHELRTVYAASDFTIVSRFAGEQKESGLVMDAARYGVPLVLSDHDPVLSQRLSDQAWVRFFRPSDPAALAALLDNLLDCPLPRPPRDVASKLGMVKASTVLEQFAALGADLRWTAREDEE
jgi:glycosyltransferase involved in cell wall biosynthesis